MELFSVIISCVLIGVVCGQNAGPDPSSIQAILNTYCQQNPDKPGCARPGAVRPNTTPTIPPNVGPGFIPNVTPGGGGGNEDVNKCSLVSRKCPQLPKVCVPLSVPCDVIGSTQRCTKPLKKDIVSQVLQCGDGTTGLRCGNGFEVPVLTQLLVQCRSTEHSRSPPITKLDVISKPGEEGTGAGVYRCGQSGSWEPLFGSPFINLLLNSCSRAGCGYVPQPDIRLPVYRGWSWVRALYYKRNIHCTAILVSPTAALTAAHCLTRSAVSVIPLDTQDFLIELPSPPNANVKQIHTTPISFHIHPSYTPQHGQQHDTAIVRFSSPTEYSLPTVCVIEEARIPSTGKQVVFGLQEGFTNTKDEEPAWRAAEASRDASCVSIGTRNSASCGTSLRVRHYQFCASHPGLSMIQGSSGGPFLVEVGTGSEEVWQVVGVLSHFSNESSCNQGHSVYSHIAEDTSWISGCAFDGLCN
ncbi:hypothetical protein Pcinc_024076 [Petrolisthes cinctipes]|uniref:Peptidase S1 domain-containing protein n=1 Tax=Petrolisthes cinctipes TaxID=88211 RepID=A0AAE1FC96_PETCI|nr:hypothetical protein Pcinc_024076 [Petrolisthes cinctipes]